MNPQHLMPGNYILYKGKEVIVTPQMLISMHSPCRSKLFSPIDLNELWLIDFKFCPIMGIGYDTNDYILEIDKYNIFKVFLRKEQKTFNKVFLFVVNDNIQPLFLKYVHQLQILYFASTQKQLTK